jgi:hypothetical protein
MTTEKILVIAKTYPTLSRRYDELVCTAGIRDDGTLVRLYPIPFRKMNYDKQYHKFQWIEVELERNLDDFRPETFRIKNYNNIKVVGRIPPDRDGTWAERRNVLLRNVYFERANLVADAYNPDIKRSLAIFKPHKIARFIIRKAESREWDSALLKEIEAKSHQIDLFLGAQNPFKVVKKLPYEFSYEFADAAGAISTLQIIDWEIGALYWNCLQHRKMDEDAACADVQKMYWENFVQTKDVYLILGTTKEYHAKNAPNPFLIISVFAPCHEHQQRLL